MCISCELFNDASFSMQYTDYTTITPTTHNVQERVFFDKELEKDYEFLKSKSPNPNAEIGVVSRSLDESVWVVVYSQSDGPTAYYTYDKTAQTVTPLFVSNPKLLPYKFAPMEDV